jgi:xanthine dehydrogenase small subunit
MSSRPIRFFHRGAVVEVDGVAPTRTVLDWLREDARCTGTKEGCNEGDCGACTVVVGTLPGEAQAGSPELVGGLRLTTTNACIQFLPTLDGKALFTVEDLKAAELHPVQQAMVECDGSQCGFCTPGFVMSLWATYQHHGARGTRPTRQQLADELSGNLCRCTGYRPILDAGERMFDLPAAPLDTAPARAALEAMRSDQTFRYAAGGAELLAPKTLEAFAAERLARPEARILAGSTDIGLWVNKMFRPLASLLYIGDVDALKRIEAKDGVLSIGAGASLEEAWRALVGRWPTLAEVWLRFAGVPLRHAGTMGGNVANGSPIGDSAPVLMALDASLVLRRGERIRRVALADFYTGYMQNRLEPGEFLQAIELPLAAATEVRAYKISKRFDCDISAVCAGLSIGLDGEVVSAVRFAFGGMAATVKRAAQTEAVVLGQPWTEATLRDAQQALAVDFAPLSDMRASAAYRLQVAQNLLRRLWLETRPASPLVTAQTSVWSTLAHAAPVAPAGAAS